MFAGIWSGVAHRRVRRKAAEKEAAGGRDVTTIRLADVTEEPDPVAALQSAGRTVTDGGDVLAVS